MSDDMYEHWGRDKIAAISEMAFSNDFFKANF